jgi:drug/metabolite transporter (DMT)-like permease
MIAILGGLGAALLWAGANLISSRSGRMIGADSTLAWMMFVGLVVGTPLALLSGPVPTVEGQTWLWLVVSAMGSVIGLLFLYRGLRVGKVGVVTALSSTEGAMAAVFSILAGEQLSLAAAALLAIIAVGVIAVALATSGETPAEVLSVQQHEGRAVLFGVAAALCFGFGIYAIGKLGQEMPPFYAVLPPRIGAVAFVMVPLALTRRLHLSRAAIPMVIGIGLGEIFGNASYAMGARDSIAVAAVLASQYGAFAAVAAFIVFRERLSIGQRGGVLAIAAGVALLTLIRG